MGTSLGSLKINPPVRRRMVRSPFLWVPSYLKRNMVTGSKELRVTRNKVLSVLRSETSNPLDAVGLSSLMVNVSFERLVTRHSADGKKFCGSWVVQPSRRSNIRIGSGRMIGYMGLAWPLGAFSTESLRLGLLVSLSRCGAGLKS